MLVNFRGIGHIDYWGYNPTCKWGRPYRAIFCGIIRIRTLPVKLQETREPSSYATRRSQNQGQHILGVPIIRIIVLGGLYWGRSTVGKLPYHPYISQCPFHFPLSFPFDSPLLVKRG